MNFVAIDFETANEKRHSPCSLGLTIVKNGKIVDEKYWMIKPPELRFNPMNIMIHGIREQDVIKAPEFDELWPEIEPYLSGNVVIAHNASFDLSVLRSTLSYYGLPYPHFDYACSMMLSKLFYPQLENVKLNTVCHHIGHHFKHHHASSDATACARIILAMAKELNVSHLDDVLQLIGLEKGKINEASYVTPKRKGEGVTSKIMTAPSMLEPSLSSVCLAETHDLASLQNKYIAFTGPLYTMTRPMAVKRLTEKGGHYTSSVTSKTNILVTNVKEPLSLSKAQMSTKLRRAITLIEEKQQSIQILTEEEFLSLLSH